MFSHLGRLEALQASPGNTEGDGKTGRGTENQGRGPGTKDPWPIYHDASLCSSESEVNLPLHNFVTHIQAQMCTDTHSHYRSLFITCALKLLPHTTTQPQLFRKFSLFSSLEVRRFSLLVSELKDLGFSINIPHWVYSINCLL